jgi:hypothetical protein
MSDESNTLPVVQPKPRPISRRVKRAIGMMVRGEVKTITAAAELAGLSREALSRALSKSHIIQYLHEKTQRSLAIAAGRAGAVKVELLDSRNARVRSDASTFVLGLAGIKPATDPQVSINIDLPRAGYVIDISADNKTEFRVVGGQQPAPALKAATPQVIDMTPHGSEPEDGDAE